MQAASGGRLTLGIGPSHPVVVENMHGLSYAKPYSHTVEYLEVLERAFAGPGQVHFEGEEFRVNALLDVPGGTPVPMLIAALAPKMLRARRQPHRGHDHVDGRRALDRGVRRAAARRRGDGGRPSDTAGGRRPAARRVRRRRRGSRARGAPVLRVRRHPHVPAHPRDRRRRPIPPRCASSARSRRCGCGSRRSATPASPTSRPSTFAVGDDRVASLRRTHELLASLAPEL